MQQKQQRSPRAASSLKEGYYRFGGASNSYKVYRREGDDGEIFTIVAVISSSKWYRKTGRRWCSFAFHCDRMGLMVWQKFRWNKKRGRDWKQVATTFIFNVLNKNMEPTSPLEEE